LPLHDVVLASALLAVKLAAQATAVQPGGGLVTFLLAPLWTVPIAWRSRRPLGVALVVAAADVVEVALVGSHDSIVFLAAFLLVPYSLAAHERSAARIAAGLAAAGAIVDRIAGQRAAPDLRQRPLPPPTAPGSRP